jgi:cellulose biosynthesis protein BcsQ
MYQTGDGMTESQFIGIVSEKGGVGKTTLTLLLALFIRFLGRRVLVIDLDPSAWSSMLLASKEYRAGSFYVDVNPDKKRESILGLVEAFLNDEDVVELFVQSIRTSTLFDTDDPLSIRYIPPSKDLDSFLKVETNLNDAFNQILKEVSNSLPDLFKDTVVLVDTAPNARLMQWAAYNLSGFPGGAFVPIGNSLMEIQGSAITVDALKQVGTTILALAPTKDRGTKSAQRELDSLSSLYRVLPIIPDTDSLANNKWVSDLRIPLRAIPCLTEICDILKIPARSPELNKLVEEGRNVKYIDVRTPLPLLNNLARVEN